MKFDNGVELKTVSVAMIAMLIVLQMGSGVIPENEEAEYLTFGIEPLYAVENACPFWLQWFCKALP